ncbi:MAG: ribonuclease HII [Clostridiales bacterium]|nr:ribonuclease HII [Clostridiales bacterium]
MTIGEIKKILADTPIMQLKEAMEPFLMDERSGVQKVLAQYKRKLEAYEKECQRIFQMGVYEREQKDAQYICGIDEVGRGPLCGPVVAAAVVLPKNCQILYVNDSKQLSATRREQLYEEIMEKAVSVGIGMSSPETIDRINILQATYEAMRQAVSRLSVKPDVLLNDAVLIPEVPIRQKKIIKGDEKSISIASASIIAKVTRDRMMEEYDKLYPGYGFASNKGYGSRAHIEALKSLGPCPIHRKTFIKNFME